MTNYYFHHSVYIFLLVGLFITSCNGQVNTTPPKETTNASKPSPEIIGTPRPIVGQPGPLNDPSLVSQYIRAIFQDSKGNYWFGPAGESVARYDIKTLKYFSKAEFFQGNESIQYNISSIYAITEDQKGNIWFGTDYGAVKYDGLTFRSYTEKDGLSNTRVGRKSILTDKAGNLWIGTAGGAFRYNPAADRKGSQCFSLFDLVPPVHVTDIMEDNTGNIWFASEDNGVFRYDPSATVSGQVIKNITEKEGLGNNAAGGMAQDKAGNIWFTMKGGICKYDPSAGKIITEFTTQDGLGGSEVWGIYIEHSGIIWITARGSTTRYDPSIDISNPTAFTVFTPEDGLNCCVQSMYQDRSGNMWWGSGQGLYRFDGEHFYQVKQNGPW
jgi:ligand-binding sensor domain-containing protein